MKKGISLILAFILIVSLTACSQNSADPSSRTPAESKTEQAETTARTPEGTQAEVSTKAPEPAVPATTEEAAVKKDLSIDAIGFINVPGKDTFRASAVILISNPSSGITYNRVKVTVSFYDEKDAFMETVQHRLTPAVRPGEQVPFRVDCSSEYTVKAARAEVSVDSFDTLDQKALQREIDGKSISLVDDGTVFELTGHEFTKKSTGKFRIDFTVKNKTAEREKCYIFFLFKKGGQIVYGQEGMLYINGSASKEDYFYADYDDNKDFPDYDEVVSVLINGH